MRQEIENWWKQAQKDFEKAKVLLHSGNYDGTAFFSQQAVEKALKALILYNKNEKPVGHSLVYLARQAKIPEKFFSRLRKLSPQYFLSRYPDASEEVPFELYDKENATEFLLTAQEVLQWIQKQLK